MTTLDAPPADIDLRSDWRSRTIDAPVEQVFAALSSPARVARWWGPADFRNTIHEFELRPGGRFRLTMYGPDGQSYPNESVFREVVPNERLVIEHVSGHHFILEIALEARGATTVVQWRQTFDTAEHYREIAAVISAANEQNLERLAAEVQRGGSA